MTNLIYNVKIVNIFFIVFPFTSYVKLQEAFFSERNAAGSWTVIGYKAPGDAAGKTTNFTYVGASISGDEGTSEAAVAGAWTAANNVKLNDCGAGVNWTLDVSPSVATSSEAASLSFSATVANDDCLALTPNFGQIGK
ncbi:MAG: hypothetical protein J6Q11_08345 [Fibrobacteraceae bacterium]|nr:hypothetical protein [Fibrobacteraceae bacterium]